MAHDFQCVGLPQNTQLPLLQIHHLLIEAFMKSMVVGLDCMEHGNVGVVGRMEVEVREVGVDARCEVVEL